MALCYNPIKKRMSFLNKDRDAELKIVEDGKRRPVKISWFKKLLRKKN